jgi:hypothetical protein
MVNYFYKVKEYFAIKGIKICKKKGAANSGTPFLEGTLDECCSRQHF